MANFSVFYPPLVNGSRCDAACCGLPLCRPHQPRHARVTGTALGSPVGPFPPPTPRDFPPPRPQQRGQLGVTLFAAPQRCGGNPPITPLLENKNLLLSEPFQAPGGPVPLSSPKCVRGEVPASPRARRASPRRRVAFPKDRCDKAGGGLMRSLQFNVTAAISFVLLH